MEFLIMDVAPGDIFSLKIAACDVKNPSKVIYPEGTRAVVKKIENDQVYLEFEDGYVEPVEVAILLYAYRRVRDGIVVHTKQTTGYGTPPPGLAPFLPPEADWRHNYRVLVTVEIQNVGLKTAVCPRCLNDLGPELKRDGQDRLFCVDCDQYVFGIDPKLFDEGEILDVTNPVPRSSKLGSTM